MKEVIAFLERGVRVALTGGGDAMLRVARAAEELKAGKRTSHPELFLFTSWGEVQDYAENDKAASDLKAIVKLVDTHGPDQIIKAVGQLSTEATAQVAVSTAHKAKGREWNTVRIGSGFGAPSVDDEGEQRALQPAEARLVYVAVTRARRGLDLKGLAWVDDYEQTTTATRPPLALLSLTAQLRHDDAPVTRFMAQHLPHSIAVQRDYLAHLTTLPRTVQPVDVRYPNWSALGHTIDYRLRLSFGGALGPAVSHGVATLAEGGPLRGSPARPGRHAITVAGRRLLDTVDAYLAGRTRLSGEELTRLCFVASFFEDIYRTGQIRRYSMLAEADAGADLAGLTAAVPGYVVEDIDEQMRLAERPLAPYRALPKQARICGPTFTGSDDVPADADFILGGVLVDCKATREPRRLGREEIHQLAAYLLLDYHDHFGITHVGFYLSRQGGLITWPVDDFLRRLGATATLPQLRTNLHSHLTQALRGHR
jgi:hypothetical protein